RRMPRPPSSAPFPYTTLFRSVGPVSVLPKEGDPRMAGVSDDMLSAVDEEVRRLIDECYAEARKLLRENRDRLDNIVAELLEHETDRKSTRLNSSHVKTSYAVF